MASGKTHDQLTIFFACAIAPAALIIPDGILFLLAGFLFSGFMFNGDLDVWSSSPTRRWGILNFYWWPYRKIFNHRSFFTHGPIFGTLIRVAYVLPLTIWWWPLSLDPTVWILIGLELGAISHTIADW